MLDQLDTAKQKILEPISESAPCGKDPKYEDNYEALKHEIAKMGGMGVGSPDWKMVEREGAALLEQKAKELNLAAYLAAAWTVNHGLEGMTAGMEMVQALIEAYWENMFPPLRRIKPRRSALTWLQDRLAERLPRCISKDAALIERAQQAVAGLKTAVYDRFEDPPCNFRRIRDTLEEWHGHVPPPEPVAPPEPIQPPEPAAVVSPEPTPPSTPAPTAPPAPVPVVVAPVIAGDANVEQLLEALAKIAGQLRPFSPNRPVSYRLQRLAVWEGATEPKANESGETFFPAPAEEVANALRTMFTRAAWDQLLERAEDLTNRWWYWLDLQYFAAQAAGQLQYQDILEVIEEETRDLETRLPGVKELKFNDGTPFASSETRDWLVQLEKKRARGGAGAEDPGAALMSNLRSLGGDKFAEAMAEAQAAVDAAPDRRTALLLRLETASFCLEVDQSEWADSLLQGLIEEMEQHQLAWWENKPAARAWSLMLETARLLKEEDPSFRDWERRAMRALATHDLARAGRFPKKKAPFT